MKDLSLTISSNRFSNEIKFYQDLNKIPKMTQSTTLDKHIWNLYEHINFKLHEVKSLDYDESDNVYSHPGITIQCRVSRKPGFFIINCLLPILMMTLCVYRFSLLYTLMLTSITFRWAIHGRVLPTVSYMTFLDFYFLSSTLTIFGSIIWHGVYHKIHLKDPVLAYQCEEYALIAYAVFVLISHVFQLIWFIIAMRKRLHLKKLDQMVALKLLKIQMNKNKILIDESAHII